MPVRSGRGVQWMGIVSCKRVAQGSEHVIHNIIYRERERVISHPVSTHSPRFSGVRLFSWGCGMTLHVRLGSCTPAVEAKGEPAGRKRETHPEDGMGGKFQTETLRRLTQAVVCVPP
jgi:hypothetical protein